GRVPPDDVVQGGHRRGLPARGGGPPREIRPGGDRAWSTTATGHDGGDDQADRRSGLFGHGARAPRESNPTCDTMVADRTTMPVSVPVSEPGPPHRRVATWKHGAPWGAVQ